MAAASASYVETPSLCYVYIVMANIVMANIVMAYLLICALRGGAEPLYVVNCTDMRIDVRVCMPAYVRRCLFLAKAETQVNRFFFT